MGIPDALVEEVRNRGDLVEIVAEITPLKRSGRTFRGACPLHGGSGPNFSIDPAKNIFKCFVCGEGGDIFSFPMKHFGMGFTDAVRWVAGRVGVDIPEEQVRDQEADPYAHYHEANAFAAEWFRGRLLDAEEGREARTYLEGRGYSAEACERFRIGWAPESWDALASAARTHGIEQSLLLELGLMKTSTRSNRDPYDAFRGRIIFPIEDMAGRTVAFGGRVIGTVEDHIPKYLNSPESPVYHKGDLLYGLRWSRGAIRKQDTALVVEGYMDYVALASHGIENVVAPLGTALTPEQAQLISRYAPRAILLYDSDSAGLKATFRSADELLRSGVEVLVATFPKGEDPDSLVRSGGESALRKYLADAVDVLERKIQILERKDYFSSIAGRRRAIDALLPSVRATTDDVLKALYIDRIAERTGVAKETVAQEAEQGGERGGRRTSTPQPQSPSRPRARSAPVRAVSGTPVLGPERNLILLLLRDEQWIDRAAERLGAEDFLDDVDREIFIEILCRNAEGEHGEPTDWAPSLSDGAAARVQDLMGDPEGWNLVHPGRFFDENVREIEARNIHRRLASIDSELRQADGSRQQELLQEKTDLRRAMERSGVLMKVSAAKRDADERDA